MDIYSKSAWTYHLDGVHFDRKQIERFPWANNDLYYDFTEKTWSKDEVDPISGTQ